MAQNWIIIQPLFPEANTQLLYLITNIQMTDLALQHELCWRLIFVRFSSKNCFKWIFLLIPPQSPPSSSSWRTRGRWCFRHPVKESISSTLCNVCMYTNMYTSCIQIYKKQMTFLGTLDSRLPPGWTPCRPWSPCRCCRRSTRCARQASQTQQTWCSPNRLCLKDMKNITGFISNLWRKRIVAQCESLNEGNEFCSHCESTQRDKELDCVSYIVSHV